MVEPLRDSPSCQLETGRKWSIQTIINVTKDQSHDHYLFFATRQGIVKRTNVNEFSNIRQNGLKALNLKMMMN